MQNRIVAKTGSRLGVALLAFSVFIGIALAEPASSSTPLTLSELQDGSLIAYPPGSGVVAGTRYIRQPGIKARNCVALGTQRLRSDEIAPALVNHCDHAVTVSYCIDAQEAGARACQAIRNPTAEVHVIPPKASLRIETTSTTLIDYPVNFVACRSAAGVLSTLTGGAHGECLMQDTSLAHAQTATAISR